MENSLISDRLRALAKGAARRPTIARMRDVIDDIEAALAAGVKRSDIVDELLKLGIKMTLSTFDSNLHRIRKKSGPYTKRQQTRPALNTLQSSKDNAPAEPSAGDASSPSHNPADIDKIIGNNPDLAALARKAKKRSM